MFLHTLGMSGGYCNVALDVICAVVFLFATRRAMRKYGLVDEEASVATLLIFMLPILATTWNPIIAELKEYLSSNSLFRWFTLAPNGDLLFLRSPEPQLSWTLLALVIAYTPSARYLPWVVLLISPFLYSLVRLPLVFTVLARLLPRRWPLAARLVTAFIAIGALIAAFVEHLVSADLRRFVVASNAPVLPVSGILAVILLLLVKKRIPPTWREMASILVASTWVGANEQIISGWMISPSKYDEYWSVTVLALIASVTIALRSQHKRRWLAAVTCVFILHALHIFSRNLKTFAHLDDPQGTINLLRASPERVAFDDLILATTADLVHARQSHTLLSFTSTYDLHPSQSLRTYLCAKQDIASRNEEIAKRFTDIFKRLDWSYTHRGVDTTITMERRPLDETPFPLYLSDLKCASPDGDTGNRENHDTQITIVSSWNDRNK